MAKRKRARHQENPSPSKTPKGEVPDFGRANPSWQIFHILQVKGTFGWDVLDKENLQKIIQRLAHLETMTWHEILVKDKKKFHAIPVEKLSTENRKRLREIFPKEDIDELVSLRMGGRERIYGIRDGASLKLLWWDPEHQVYPSQKKHT